LIKNILICDKQKSYGGWNNMRVNNYWQNFWVN